MNDKIREVCDEVRAGLVELEQAKAADARGVAMDFIEDRVEYLKEISK